jgi:hypothetical protein
MVLPMAICEICPASEGDIMISVLLNLFDTRASLMSLLKLMIDREIAHTGAANHLYANSQSLFNYHIQKTRPRYFEAIQRAPSFCPRSLKFTDTTT